MNSNTEKTHDVQPKRVIGIMGKSKSGKDTVGEMLIAHDPRGGLVAFADKLKMAVADLFGATHEQLYTEEGKKSKTSFPLLKCPACQSIKCEVASPGRDGQTQCLSCNALGETKSFSTFWEWREICQFAGTEFGRAVDANVWVRHAFKAITRLMTPMGLGSTDGSVPSTITPGCFFVAITDCRFKSEMTAIKAAGGEVWRVRRPEYDNRQTGLAKHQSETEMDTIPDTEFDAVIMNDATLEVLRARVVEQYESFRMRHE